MSAAEPTSNTPSSPLPPKPNCEFDFNLPFGIDEDDVIPPDQPRNTDAPDKMNIEDNEATLPNDNVQENNESSPDEAPEAASREKTKSKGKARATEDAEAQDNSF